MKSKKTSNQAPLKKKIQDTGVEKKTSSLEGKRIAFAICGGIGAVDTVRAIRELRRHGASIFPYLSPGALEFISETSVSWAADRKAVVHAGWESEHLLELDAVVVAPATLNTLAKAAVGIADNNVSLLLASQMGRKIPILMVPTMNAEMAKHPAYPAHKKTLESWGVQFYSGKIEESRLKMPEPEALADFVIEHLV